MFGFGRKSVGQSVSFTLVIAPNGDMSSHAEIPEFADAPTASVSAANVAQALHLLNSGRLLPLIQKAIAVGAEKKRQDGYSYAVLQALNGLAAFRREEGPLVSPREAFDPGPHGGGLND